MLHSVLAVEDYDMARGNNIFYNLVNNENSHTELLCNLMRFAAFRRPMLAKLLPGLPETCASQIGFEDIDTQASFENCGRPDLIIENATLYALVEVKIYQFRAPTANQPNGYFKILTDDKEKTRERWLAFLVPKGWEYRHRLDEDLEKLKADYHAGIIHTHVAEWEDVLTVIEDNELQILNPFLNEFYQLLVAWLRPQPITFNTTEVLMLFNNKIPTALSKLDKLVLEIRAKSSTYKVDGPERPKGLCPEEEYGLYFRNDQDLPVLWFGVWIDFWKEKGFPLCFGVAVTSSPAVIAAFKKYPGKTMRFPDKNPTWILGWVSQETLADEKNAVDEVWKQLAPVLDAVVKADG